jgi:lipopolysaccharide transport system permease protein
VDSDVKDVLEVRPGTGRLTADTVAELGQFGAVLSAFAARFVKVKYKQMAVGLAWALLQPALSAGVLALVIGATGQRLAESHVPYLLFVLAGMVGWTYFATATNAAAQSIVDDAALIQKVYFPREIIPIAAVLAALVDLAAALLTLAALTAAYGNLPTASWLALPLPIIVLTLCATAAGLALSALNVYYRDVRYVLPFILQIGLFGSAVFYSPDSLAAPWNTIFTIANPVAAAIDSLRTIMIFNDWPDVAVVLPALAWAAVMATLGLAVFKRLEREFSDRV